MVGVCQKYVICMGNFYCKSCIFYLTVDFKKVLSDLSLVSLWLKGNVSREKRGYRPKA